MSSRTRRMVPLTIGIGLAVITAGLAPGTAHSQLPSPGDPSSGNAPHWIPPSRSGLVGPVQDVLAAAPPDQPIRIVTVTVRPDGGPDISVRTAPSVERAAAVVVEERRTPGVVSVSVDQRMSILDSGQLVTVPAEHTSRVAVSGDQDSGIRVDPVVAPWTSRSENPRVSSTDEYRQMQWGLDRLFAEQVWTLNRAEGQLVAVVDSGVDGAHEDLSAAVVPGTDYVAENGGDGRSDPNGHGTHVAGIIAATANNGIGVAGLAPGAKILPVRVADETGSGYSSDMAEGVIYSVDHQASVINISMGSTMESPAVAAAVRYAQDHDVVVVAAAGNEREEGNPVEYPAALDGVVGVAATNSDDGSAEFSETGYFVDVAAPGVQIASTYPGSQYMMMSGTSMASPFAAAVAALIRASNPGLTQAEVANRMASTAEDLGPQGRDDEFGAGLVNPLAAMGTGPQPTTTQPTQPTQPTTEPTQPTTEPTQPTTEPTQPTQTTTTQPTTEPTQPTLIPTYTTLQLAKSKVTYGGTSGLSAQVYGSDGTGISGEISICGRPLSSDDVDDYQCTAITLMNGEALATLTVGRSYEIVAVYLGNETYDASMSNPSVIKVKAKISIKGGRGKMTGKVTPAIGQKVKVQRRSDGRWKTVAKGIVYGSGKWSFIKARRGKYRVVVPAAKDLLGTTSKTVKIT